MNAISRYLNKFKSLPVGVKASIAFALCSMIQKGIQFITIPIFGRILTTEQYGQYSMFQTWYSVIFVFATLNLSGGCFNNGMMKYPEDRYGFISSMQGLSTLVTFITFFLCAILYPFLGHFVKLPVFVLIAMFVYLLFEPSITFWSAKQRYEYKYIALVIYTIGFSIIETVLGLLAVLFYEEKGIARILSVCIVNVLAGLFFYILNFARGKKFHSNEYWSFALRFNLPLVPHYLSQIVLGMSDRIMIENMEDTSTVGIYGVAYNLGMIISIFVSSINASFIPWSFSAMKREDYQGIRKLSNGLVLLMGIIALLPIMLAPEAIMIIGRPEYFKAVWIIPPVALSALLTFIYSLFGNIEFYFEKSKYVMIATVTAAVSNIILNYFFIRIFGFIAAGFTTLACYAIMVIMHYIFMKKICSSNGIGKIYDLKFIIFIVSLLCFVSPFFMLLYNTYIPRYIVLLILLIVVFVKRKFFINIFKQIKNK